MRKLIKFNSSYISLLYRITKGDKINQNLSISSVIMQLTKHLVNVINVCE